MVTGTSKINLSNLPRLRNSVVQQPQAVTQRLLPAMQKLSGYTLIEILIVMLIISIVGGVAILTISHNRNSQYATLAKQLVNQITLAEQQAMLLPATIGVNFSDQSYQFYRYTEDQKKQTWEPLKDTALSKHRIPRDTQMRLVINGKTIPNTEASSEIKPYLIISSSGDMPDFIIYIGKTDSKPSYKIVGKENGSIQSEPVQEK